MLARYTVTEGTWPSYVVNLADNTARMENARAQLDAQGIHFTRVEAVWGADLTPEQVAEVYDEKANRRRGKQDLVAGELGCYLSHIKAWQAIVASDAPGGFVFEDDFKVKGDLAEVLRALSAREDLDWDVVKLFSINNDPGMISASPLVGAFSLGTPYRVPTTMLGYGLKRASAAALLKRCVPFFRPIDEDHKFFWEHGQRIALVQPNSLEVGDEQAVTGTIGDARRSRSKSDALRKLKYQLDYQIRLRWHRWAGRT
ncbi:glycosyltransferase family 25 protein [Rhodobacteraceae bacterium M385]|nr:glycosyltransferase family 25 protein [Rhodobacteraceae bacterium M385]